MDKDFSFAYGHPGINESTGFDYSRTKNPPRSLLEEAIAQLEGGVCPFAEGLGGSESLITYPVTQTHMDVPEEERIARGITNTLLRFSVGLEAVEDLKADLNRALQQ